MKPKHGEHSKRHRAITGALFVAAGLACTLLLEHFGVLNAFSRSLLDSIPLTMSATESEKVTIVAINDQDYADLFGKTSPLRPQVVVQIIDAIQAFAPRVIGVDLDTEDWPPGHPMPKDLPGRVVWARTFAANAQDRSKPLEIESLNKVLGSDGKNVCFGLTGMQSDPDYVIRQYPAVFAGGAQRYLAFPLVMRELAKNPQCPPDVEAVEAEPKTERNWDEDRLLLRFRGEQHEIHKISAGAVLEMADVAKHRPHDAAVERTRMLLAGRIVLLGGTYAAGRDFYPTPVGMISGVDILGHAILTAGEPRIGEFNIWWAAAFDAALGLSLVALGLYYPRTALLLNFAILILMLPVSAFLFRSFAFFLNAIPVQVSVMLHSVMHPMLESKIEERFGK